MWTSYHLTLLLIETVRFTIAPFAIDVFALGVHLRGTPRSAVRISGSACIVFSAAVRERKGAFSAGFIARISTAFELWNEGGILMKCTYIPGFLD